MKCSLSILIVVLLGCVYAHDLSFPFKPTIDVKCVTSTSRTYSRVGMQYYFFGNSKVNWFEAVHICRRYGGDLALIESPQQLSAIDGYLKSQGNDGNAWFWISGNDLFQNHNFFSIATGLPLPYTQWSSGQPDFPGTEHCMHLWLREGSFKMNNWVCHEKAFYICQRSANSTCYVTN